MIPVCLLAKLGSGYRQISVFVICSRDYWGPRPKSLIRLRMYTLIKLFWNCMVRRVSVRRYDIYHPCTILHMYLICNLFNIVNNEAYFLIMLIKQTDILSLSVTKQPEDQYICLNEKCNILLISAQNIDCGITAYYHPIKATGAIPLLTRPRYFRDNHRRKVHP